jgi:ribosomal protein L19
MNPLVKKVIDKEIETLKSTTKNPGSVRVGDVISIAHIIDGQKYRLNGVIIALKNGAFGPRITMLRTSTDPTTRIKKIFDLYSPAMEVKVVKHLKFRKSKLYYLENLSTTLSM